jgi:HSP20 family protein
MNQIITRAGLFDDFFRDVAPGFYVKPLHGDPLPSQVKVDVTETPQAYVLKADLPGVNKQDIHVQVEGNRVSLSAEVRQEDRLTEGEKVLRSERCVGSVARSFQLPEDIDNAAAKARYDNGVLTLTLPKRLAAAGQKLTIE